MPTDDRSAKLGAEFAGLIKAMPHLQSLFCIDAQGGLVAHSSPFGLARLNYAHEPWFAEQHNRSQPGLSFGAPATSLIPDQQSITMSRAALDQSDQLQRVLVAQVHPSYFESLYRPLDLGPDDEVTLMRRDLKVLVSSKFAMEDKTSRINNDARWLQRALSASEAQVTIVRSHGGQSAAIAALGSVPDQPLLILNSVSEHDVLADWRKQLWFAAPSAVAVSALLLVLALLLARALKEDADLRETLNASEQRWRFALEGAGHGVWDWDTQSDQVLQSAHHAEMLDLPQTYSAHQLPWHEKFHPDDLPRAQAAAAELLDGRRNEFSDELRARDARGDWKYVLIRGTVTSRDEAGRARRIVGTVTDVTPLRQAERRLIEQEARVAAIVNSAMDAVITVDQQQRVILFNTAAEKMFGIAAEQARGTSLDRFLPDRYREAHRAHIERFGETQITTRRMGQRLSLFALRGDGNEFPIDASISHVLIGEQKFFTVILRDITERVAAEAEIDRSHQELRALSRSANEALEAERRRVARELHDELGQQLTALKLDLGEIEKLVGEKSSTESIGLRAACSRMRSLIDQTVASTRRISTELRISANAPAWSQP
jgi:PAS domain S-box-containing protein